MTFILLSIGVMALLAVAAVLTISLFDIKIDPPPPEKELAVEQEPTQQEEMITEVFIDLENTDPAPAQTKKSLPRPQTTQNKPSPAQKASTKSHSQPSPVKPDKAGIGTVSSITGTAFATNPAQKKRILAENSRVHLHETIETGRDSRLGLIFDDGTELSQTERSIIVLDQYLYNPDKKENNAFSARFLKGACRLITGAIVKMNPERFQVKTRMATAGIRGTRIAFESAVEKDDIYVLDISGDHSVEILTTIDGSAMMNAVTGDPIEVKKEKKKTFILKRSGEKVSIISGGGPKVGVMTADEARNIINTTSHLPPAEYKINQTPSSTKIKIKPGNSK